MTVRPTAIAGEAGLSVDALEQGVSRANQWRRRLLMLGLLVAASGSARAQFIERIVADDGAQPAAESAFGPPAISTDGQFVAFTSLANNLLGPGLDNNGVEDVFVANLGDGTVERVSVSSSGVEGNNRSGVRINLVRSDIGISDDGNLVVFTSLASNLVEGDCMAVPVPADCDNNNQFDLFLHNRQTGVTTRQNISQRAGITLGKFPGLDLSIAGTERAAISGDGRYVAFIQAAFIPLVAGDADEFGNGEVYLREIDGPLTRASLDLAPDVGVDASGPLSLSDDGNRLVYVSNASTLVAGDTNNQFDVFMFERSTGTITRVSVTDNELQTDGPSRTPVISGDGRYVAFFSSAPNLGTGGGVYLRDLVAGTTTRITGTGCVPLPAFGCTVGTSSSRISISDDGRFVAFDYTGNDLFWPGDSNLAADVYLYDRVMAQVHRISVDTAGGNPDFSATTPAVTDDGGLVAFTSFASDLVGAPSCLVTPNGPTCDTNNRADVFVGTPAGAATILRPIQSVLNRVPRSDGKVGYSLVASKELALRTYVRTPRPLGEMFDAFAEACIDGSVTSCPIGKSFQAVGKVHAFGTQFSEQDRRDGLDSINLVLRNGAESILTPGAHTIEVRVSPDTPGAFPVVTRKVDAMFHVPQTFDVLAYPVELEDILMMPVLPSAPLMASAADFLRANYPVDEQGVKSSVRKPLAFAPSPVTENERRNLALALSHRFAEDRKTLTAQHRFAVGVVPADLSGLSDGLPGLNGYTYLDLKGVVVSADQREHPILPGTLMHEIGHQFGLDDEYCFDATPGEVVLETPCPIVPGVPNPPPQSALLGNELGTYLLEEVLAFDVKPVEPGRTAVFGPPGDAVFGYMGSGSAPKRWTTGVEYAHLYQTITTPSMGPGVASGLSERMVAFVSGLIHQDGTVALSPLIVYETDAELPQPNPGNAYAIDLVDGGDQVVGTVEFDLTFLMELLGEDESEVREEQEVPFGVWIELPAGAETLRLRQGATPLAEQEKSANAPTVEFLSVTAQAGNVLDLEWAGSDLDGGDLTYTLLYSPDGVVLESLAVGLTATTFSLDLDDLTPVSFGAFLRVQASDGWNTAHDDHGIGPEFAVLDVDADGSVQPLTDGLLILRHLFGFSGNTLIAGAVGEDCDRCLAADITTYLDGVAPQFDADADGAIEPLTDGLLILRYLFGFSGSTLIAGALGVDCDRCDPGVIAGYLGGLD